MVDSSPKTIIIVDGEADKDIPDPFPFPPHYQPDIELSLKLRVLQPNQVARLITRLDNAMFLYKRYPKRCEYERVAQQVIQKYPFLKSPIHPYVSLHNLFTLRLQVLKAMYKVQASHHISVYSQAL